MDAIAALARMSKRTLYARYADKTALFRAVLNDLIERWLIPLGHISADSSDLETTLLKIARHLAQSALQPELISVDRVVVSESERWPEFGSIVNEKARRPALNILVEILSQHRNQLRDIDLAIAAEQFLSLSVDGHLRRAHIGEQLDETAVERWTRASVDLFLSGILTTESASARSRSTEKTFR